MARDASRPLTDRQIAVLERIDQRIPIKVIARDLGVSDTRINQHIRALKDIFDAGSLGDLVAKYRESEYYASDEGEKEKENQEDKTFSKGLSEEPYSIPQVPAAVFGFDMADRDSASHVEMNDVLPLIERAPWLKPGEPKVVPGLLDGEHAVLFRLAAIMGIAFGFLAAVVLTVTAAVTISEALSDRAHVPVDEQGFT